MCNPGSCYEDLRLDVAGVLKFARDYEKETCYNDARVYGRPVGAVRVSVGYPTTMEELDKVIDFIKVQYLQ